MKKVIFCLFAMFCMQSPYLFSCPLLDEIPENIIGKINGSKYEPTIISDGNRYIALNNELWWVSMGTALESGEIVLSYISSGCEWVFPNDPNSINNPIALVTSGNSILLEQKINYINNTVRYQYINSNSDILITFYVTFVDSNYYNGYDSGYEAGKQYCIEYPQACGIEVNGSSRPPFTGALAENIQSYLVLTDSSAPFYLSPGSYVQAFGSESINTINVEKYARVQLQNFIGSNVINIEEESSDFTCYRSGVTVYLNSALGTLIEIAATSSPQTLRFANGSSELLISNDSVILGEQIINDTASVVESPVDSINSSENIF